MIRNYFKIAYRNLVKNKTFSLINIAGLSIGITACMLISVYILHESNYDSHINNARNVYRLYQTYNIDGKVNSDVAFSANMAATVKNDFPEVISSGRIMDNNLFYGAGANEVKFDGDPIQHHEEGFAYADPSILQIMDVKMVFGNQNQALTNPKSIVISKKIANKFFKDQNPISNSMYLNGNTKEVFTIGGVMENFPTNSHLHYDYLITLNGVEFGDGEQTRWVQSNYTTYVLMKPEVDIALFGQKMSNAIIVNYIKPALKDIGWAGYVDLEKKAKITMQPLADINLHSTHISRDSVLRNDIKIIWIFGIVALFILVIASINFINMSTAKSANRAKEVGLRKVVGSTRSHLIWQFLSESLLITMIAAGLSFVLAIILLSYFGKMAGKELNMPFDKPLFLPSFLGISILIGLLSGLYPSVFLSSFNPIQVLKGKLRMGSRSGSLRSSLVVFQFAISAILIVGTLIVNQQMNYILTSKIGFEKDQVLQIYSTNMLGEKIGTFKEELKKLPGVQSVTVSDYLPIENTKRNGNSFVNDGKQGIDHDVSGQSWIIDEDYLTTLGIKLVKGRNFQKNFSSDDKAVIINQEMAKRLNLSQPLGKVISRNGEKATIIGVVQNFNFDNMRKKIEPLALFKGISPDIISIKVNSQNVNSILAALQSKWTAFVPTNQFRYAFMDESFSKMYESVSRIKAIFTSFAMLAIFVACLGLFALSAFIVEQRNKEISIRKVLGATVYSIFRLLTNNFVILILIALLIAFPIAYYLMNRWLADFEYRINISWQQFALAGSIAVAIALLTISYQSIKAALMNPVKSLKTE